jgi:hypothetical protein
LRLATCLLVRLPIYMRAYFLLTTYHNLASCVVFLHHKTGNFKLHGSQRDTGVTLAVQ